MIDLNELNKILVKNNCVHNISLDIDIKSCKYNLLLIVGEFDHHESEKVTLCFYDISNLTMAIQAGGLIQFMLMGVEKLDNTLERQNYVFQELEDESIQFKFSDMDVL